MSGKINTKSVDLKYFIKTVRKYEDVWNKNSDGNKDLQARESAWLSITKETHFGDVRRAKMQWKKLRDNHREAFKRRQNNKREGRKNLEWKYESLMDFIVPHMNINIENPFSDDVGLDSKCEIEQIDSCNRDIENESNADFKIEQIANPLECDDEYEIEDNLVGYGNAPKQDNKNWEQSDADVLDPLDHFFASVCQSIKRLPTAAQLKLKKKIMLLVIEEEEFALESNQT